MVHIFEFPYVRVNNGLAESLVHFMKKKIGEYKRNDGALQKNVNIGKAPERLRAENFLNAHHSFFMSRNLEISIYVNINLL